MTIALGFICPDGVVLATDRRISGGGTLTFGETKTTQTRWKNGCAVISYAGHRDSWLSFCTALSRCLGPNTEADESAFHSVLTQLLRALPKTKEGIALLCGYWMSEGPRLVKVDSSGVVPIQSSEVIGWGNSPLARYLLQRYENSPFRSVAQARIYGVNFISQASRGTYYAP